MMINLSNYPDFTMKKSSSTLSSRVYFVSVNHPLFLSPGISLSSSISLSFSLTLSLSLCHSLSLHLCLTLSVSHISLCLTLSLSHTHTNLSVHFLQLYYLARSSSITTHLSSWMTKALLTLLKRTPWQCRRR